MLTPDSTHGHLDLLVLAVVAGHKIHGYALIDELREQSDGAFDLPEGTVYPALHRLEAAGLLVSQFELVNGRRRRYYSITPRGRSGLVDKRQQWAELVTAVTRIVDAHPRPVCTSRPALERPA